ncbi:MAG: hypothetical protein PHW13_01085 [Methylococcales bacterium]|nr:hypothetical protein [Methylococcales bacterium]
MINSEQINAESLSRFRHYINDCRPLMKKQYEQLLARDLSQQRWEGCFRRNVPAVLEQTYDAALKQLLLLPFDSSDSRQDKGLLDLQTGSGLL